MNNPPPPPDPGHGPSDEPPPYRDQPYQPYGQPPPPPGPAPKQGGVVAGFAVAGASLFIALNAVFGFVVFVGIANSTGNSYRVILGLAAAFGALAAFGGGTVLILLRKPVTKGLGMGLMIGWALVTICTAGFCTGVNPNLYSAPQTSATFGENGAHP